MRDAAGTVYVCKHDLLKLLLVRKKVRQHVSPSASTACSARLLTQRMVLQTLGSAMLLLFQCLTGDNWSGMMADAQVHELSGHCTEAEGNCGSWVAVPYFIAFEVIGAFVFLNLVVAVILENFSSLGSVRTDLVSAADLVRP